MIGMEDYNYEEKISGTVENVVFQNTTNFFTVLEVNVSGEIITAVGSLTEIAAGEDVVLYGTWGAHEVFGRQFKISSCQRSLPDTTAKLYRYLASGAIKGIGPKTAIKIIERFGEKSFGLSVQEAHRVLWLLHYPGRMCLPSRYVPHQYFEQKTEPSLHQPRIFRQRQRGTGHG